MFSLTTLTPLFSPFSLILDEILLNDHLLAFIEKNPTKTAFALSFLLILDTLIKLASSALTILVIILLLSI